MSDSYEVKCWCGAQMTEPERDAWPYDCRAKDKHPGALVFRGCLAGHTGWTYRKDAA